ncbi:3-oxoacyl-[acyl-carrier-protein] reductase [Streptomyces lactacystinicus]|uniref:SDR family NAD(P)-dependent oxidoreductase n=1 Tax=unclassified Kitasatospora TaxID=2633591 RepID=UPI0033761869
MELVGDTAIVTGASKGIGYAIADRLMSRGADVVVTARNRSELTAAAARLTSAHADDGTRAVPVVADVSRSADMTALFDRAIAELGSVGILVNNAGTSTFDLTENLPEDDFDAVVATHLKGTYLGTKAAINHMKTIGGGVIVNLGAVDGFATTRGNAHYSAAKAGIAKFTEATALEAGRYGIRINAVAPGAVQTPLAQEFTTPEFEAAWHRTFAIDRMGRPDDIAKAVVFLASDHADWITGITLLVDGGTHLRGLPDYADFLLPGT